MLHDRVIERYVALFLPDLDHARDLMRFRFADKIRDGYVYDEDLERGKPAWFIDAFKQVLRDHDFERASREFGFADRPEKYR